MISLAFEPPHDVLPGAPRWRNTTLVVATDTGVQDAVRASHGVLPDNPAAR